MREAQKRIEAAESSGYANLQGNKGKGKKGPGGGGNSFPSGSQTSPKYEKNRRGGGGESLEGSDVEGSVSDGSSVVGYGSDGSSLAQEDYEAMLAAMGYERRREHLKVAYTLTIPTDTYSSFLFVFFLLISIST